MDGQSGPPKTPEQIRAERIAAIADPKMRQELDAIANSRDAKLVELREIHTQRYEKDVADIRRQKMNSANAPQFTPPGMQQRPYLGVDGYQRATLDAKAEVARRSQNALNSEAKPYNVQIDNRLDAHRDNQAGRARLDLKPAEPGRGPVVTPMSPARGPNRYAALIGQQKYDERANQAEANRKNEQDITQQQQRQRGPQR
jgi:hypothetical protein